MIKKNGCRKGQSVNRSGIHMPTFVYLLKTTENKEHSLLPIHCPMKMLRIQLASMNLLITSPRNIKNNKNLIIVREKLTQQMLIKKPFK